MSIFKPIHTKKPAYPQHKTLRLRHAGISITVLIMGLSSISGCGTEEEKVVDSVQADVEVSNTNTNETETREETDATQEDPITDPEEILREELRVPEEGSFWISSSGDYYVVLQVPSNLISTIAGEEEVIKDAARNVLPNYCSDFRSGPVSDEVVEAFVEDLPQEWQIKNEDTQIFYSCEFEVAGDAYNDSWPDSGRDAGN